MKRSYYNVKSIKNKKKSCKLFKSRNNNQLFSHPVQKEGLKKFQEEELPDYMEKLEKILIQYKEGNSFFVRESVSHEITSIILILYDN